MTDRDALTRWVQSYVRAWGSNDPQDIRALFTEDAAYFTEPHAEPWVGHEEIVRQWLDRKDDPGEWTFRWEILATGDGLGFVRGWTSYLGEQPHDYQNLWVIRLAENGKASEYTEWWVRVRATSPPHPE